MGRPIAVIESKRWKHTSGRTASIYGALPWTNDADKPYWRIEIIGYALKMSNGTVGYGRLPLSTQEEAQAIMDKILERYS